MNIILFDDQNRTDLLPLSYTRPVSEMRVGILTIREKWELDLKATTSWLTADYLKSSFSVNIAKHNLLINAALCPDKDILSEINTLETFEKLMDDEVLLAVKLPANDLEAFLESNIPLERIDKRKKQTRFAPHIIRKTWHIFQHCGDGIQADFQRLTSNRTGQVPDATNTIFGTDVFIEAGAQVRASILNAENGPIYIGKDAEVMEGSVIRGPFALCDHGTVKMSAKIYGATAIGPHCKVGGEVNNSVFFGYSNKGHDGFLGNSVIGEWCNLGADTNTSNLKNNYGPVKVWNYTTGQIEPSGLQFCGLTMGDHSKCGINTMFNTGTVIGVSANIYGGDFPPKFIPSFSWGGASGFQSFKPEKAFESAGKMMERRGKTLSENDKAVLTHIFDQSAHYRKE